MPSLQGVGVINDKDDLVLDATTNFVIRCIPGRDGGDNDDDVAGCHLAAGGEG